jgi:hypothetical protein
LKVKRKISPQKRGRKDKAETRGELWQRLKTLAGP